MSVRRLLVSTVLGVIVVMLAITEYTAIADRGLGSDFAGNIYAPVVAVVHGHSPYGDPRIPGPLQGSVYPPSAFMPVVWLGLLSHDAAVAVWLTLTFAAAFGALWVLGVRDPRFYVLWILNPLLLSTALIGNTTVIVIFLAAALWRWRDNAVGAAVALTAAIAIKLFLAPLVLWLLFQRRYLAAIYTAIAVPVVLFIAWATIRFSAIERYPTIIKENSKKFVRSEPFLQSFVTQLGGSPGLALAVGIVVAAGLLLAARGAGDLGGFTLVVMASITLSPISQIGYAGLFVIPIAGLWGGLSKPLALLLLIGCLHWYHLSIPYGSIQLTVLTSVSVAMLVAWIVKRSRAAETQRPAVAAA